MIDNTLSLPDCPSIILKKFEYNETTQELTVELVENNELNIFVAEKLKTETVTHEQVEEFITNIIIKALQKSDGYDIS